MECHGKCLGVPASSCPYHKEGCNAPSSFIDKRVTWDEAKALGFAVIVGKKSVGRNEDGKAVFAPWQLIRLGDQTYFSHNGRFSEQIAR